MPYILFCALIVIWQSIVRAECRRLCGAIEYSEVATRRNSHPIRRMKYILPDPDGVPRRDANGTLLHNPQWGKPVANNTNALFINAVIEAVRLVPVSCTNYLCLL